MEEIWEKIRRSNGDLNIDLFDNILPPIINGKLPEELTNDPRYNTITNLSLSHFDNLTTIDKFPANLKHFGINNCINIENLKNFPLTLKTLIIESINNLSLIDDLSNIQLEIFKIKDCPRFRTFPNLPLTLKMFECDSNTYIDGLPNFEIFPNLNLISLQHLVVSETPSLPNSLENLYINETHIKRLPSLLTTSLKNIYITNNSLEELPALPQTLNKLTCINCNLKHLPNLPQALTELNILNNLLTELPELPNSLKVLIVSSNRLTNLPDPLPPNLTKLYFNNNMITIVPELPQNLLYINGTNNPLIRIPTISSGRLRAQFDNIHNQNNNVIQPTLFPPNPPQRQISPTIYPQPPNYPPHSQQPLETNNPLQFKPTQKAYDAINNEEISIKEYLDQPDSQEEQNFILHLNGEFICQSLKGVRLSNAETVRPTDYVEYYECKDETPSEWQGNTYIRDWLKPQGRGPFVKLMGPGGSKYLIDKPAFFWNGPIPGSKVFNMVETSERVKKYVSSHALPIRPGFSAMGADHCNQTGPERLFRLELMIPENQSAGKKRQNKSKKYQSKRQTKKRTTNKNQKKGKKFTKKIYKHKKNS